MDPISIPSHFPCPSVPHTLTPTVQTIISERNLTDRKIHPNNQNTCMRLSAVHHGTEEGSRIFRSRTGGQKRGKGQIASRLAKVVVK